MNWHVEHRILKHLRTSNDFIKRISSVYCINFNVCVEHNHNCFLYYSNLMLLSLVIVSNSLIKFIFENLIFRLNCVN